MSCLYKHYLYSLIKGINYTKLDKNISELLVLSATQIEIVKFAL